MANRTHRAGSAATLPLNLLAQALPMLTRSELTALTERLIERLDLLDGDPDIEDDTEDCCEAGDDGCGPIYRHGIRFWGSDHEGADYA